MSFKRGAQKAEAKGGGGEAQGGSSPVSTLLKLTGAVMMQAGSPKSLLLCQNPLIERLSAFLYSFKTQNSLAVNERLLGCCDVLFCFLPRPWRISLFLDKPGIFLVDVAGTLGLLTSLSEQAVFITSPTAIPSLTTHLGNLIFSSSNTQALSDFTDEPCSLGGSVHVQLLTHAELCEH